MPALLSSDHLTIYLNDHLAGATAGADLARRTAAENAGTEFGPALRELADEIGRDRDELLAIIDELGRPVDHVKAAVGWSIEKLGRLKPNGRVFGYSPLSRLLELEGLASGIRGKAALWRALATVSPETPRPRACATRAARGARGGAAAARRAAARPRSRPRALARPRQRVAGSSADNAARPRSFRHALLTPAAATCRVRNRLSNRLPLPDLPAAPAAKRRATLADVARRAQVSSSTASRALTGRGTLSPATRAAVAVAAAELGYRPSPLARSLRMRRTHTVGLVVPDISSPFYAAALKGAQRALERRGYRLMLMDSAQDAGREAAALETLIDHQVDGLLLATTGIAPARFDEIVGASETPCVFFDEILPAAGRGSVGIENGRGMDLLVGHLVEHGHTRIALLTGPRATRARRSAAPATSRRC